MNALIATILLYAPSTISEYHLTQEFLPTPKQEPIYVNTVNPERVVQVNTVVCENECKNVLVNGVKHWEGFKSEKYVCSGGKVTLGYGFTGKEIGNMTRISKEYAHKHLIENVLPKYEKDVEEIVNVPLTPYQKAALVSFTYNLGRTNLIRLVSGEGRLNDGNYESIIHIMPKYRKAGGHVNRGLELRRAWEVDMFMGKLHSQYGNL